MDNVESIIVYIAIFIIGMFVGFVIAFIGEDNAEALIYSEHIIDDFKTLNNKQQKELLEILSKEVNK